MRKAIFAIVMVFTSVVTFAGIYNNTDSIVKMYPHLHDVNYAPLHDSVETNFLSQTIPFMFFSHKEGNLYEFEHPASGMENRTIKTLIVDSTGELDRLMKLAVLYPNTLSKVNVVVTQTYHGGRLVDHWTVTANDLPAGL